MLNIASPCFRIILMWAIVTIHRMYVFTTNKKHKQLGVLYLKCETPSASFFMASLQLLTRRISLIEVQGTGVNRLLTFIINTPLHYQESLSIMPYFIERTIDFNNSLNPIRAWSVPELVGIRFTCNPTHLDRISGMWLIWKFQAN